MGLRGKPITEITEPDLRRLITDRVRESQTQDYKREAYGRGDEHIREMLRDISAMANAFGGDLLIGVEEDGEGIAIDLPGIGDAEEESQRIVSSCLSNIQERIPGLVAWPTPLSNGRSVIVVRIPRSLRAPHMVTFKGENRFWARHDRQKSPMSIHEIREACLKVEGLMEKLEGFLEKRKQEVLEEIGTLPCYIASVTPIFVDSEVVDIQDPQLRSLLKNPPGNRPNGWCVPSGETPRPTLHGLKSEVADWKSVELFLNGHLELLVKLVKIETVSFLYGHIERDGQEHPIFQAYPLVGYPLSLFRLGKAIYAHLGLTDPVVVSLSLYNIEGFGLLPEVLNNPGRLKVSTRLTHLAGLWRKKALEIPPKQVPSLEPPEKVTKELVDRIWQAFGHEQAPLFDAEGNFRPL